MKPDPVRSLHGHIEDVSIISRSESKKPHGHPSENQSGIFNVNQPVLVFAVCLANTLPPLNVIPCMGQVMAFQALCAPGLVVCGGLLFGTHTVLAIGEKRY